MASPTLRRVRRPRGSNFSREERVAVQAKFLEAVADAHSITCACELAGIDRMTFRWWEEHDEEFSLQYHQALEAGNDRIREEFRRRGIEGWESPVYQAGRLVGQERKYSDGLLTTLAKSRMPEFRDKYQLEHSGPNGGPIVVDDYRERLRALAARQREAAGVGADARGSDE